MKGTANIIATILLVVVVLALGAMFLFWSMFFWQQNFSTVKSSAEEPDYSVQIIGVYTSQNHVRLYNDGVDPIDLSKVKVYMDGNDVTSSNSGILRPGNEQDINAQISSCSSCRIKVAVGKFQTERYV